MARIKMDGLSYFPFDVTFFDNRKIKVLRSKFGNDAVSLYIYLLCEIYREKGYYLEIDDDFYAVVADDNGIAEEKAKEIVAYFCRNNYFNSTFFDKNILTSTEIQKQYQESMKVRGRYRKILVNTDVWMLSDDENEDFIRENDDFLKENDDFLKENDTKKSKENKSKVNESKEKKNICTPVGDKKTFADNVLLTDKEYQALLDRFGQTQTDEMLKKLSHYKAANGKEYASDYDAVLSWVVSWYEKSRKKGRGKTGESTFDIEAFTKWEFEKTYKK